MLSFISVTQSKQIHIAPFMWSESMADDLVTRNYLAFKSMHLKLHCCL